MIISRTSFTTRGSATSDGHWNMRRTMSHALPTTCSAAWRAVCRRCQSMRSMIAGRNVSTKYSPWRHIWNWSSVSTRSRSPNWRESCRSTSCRSWSIWRAICANTKSSTSSWASANNPTGNWRSSPSCVTWSSAVPLSVLTVSLSMVSVQGRATEWLFGDRDSQFIRVGVRYRCGPVQVHGDRRCRSEAAGGWLGHETGQVSLCGRVRPARRVYVSYCWLVAMGIFDCLLQNRSAIGTSRCDQMWVVVGFHWIVSLILLVVVTCCGGTQWGIYVISAFLMSYRVEVVEAIAIF